MIILGATVNAVGIILGVLFGILARKRITNELNHFLMQGLGICVIYVGIRGSLSGENTIITIISMVIGGVLGHRFDFDKRLESLGNTVQNRFQNGDSESDIATGFINCTLLVCVGSMAIVGSLQSGISGNNEILYSKAMIDTVAALVMAAAMGWGVALAAIPLFLYEGGMTLLADLISPFLGTSTVNEMTCVGSLLIIMIGLNMMKLTKIKVANFLLVPFLPILLCYLAVFLK